jgi:UDP-N-acetylmuramoyl-L-alanyl-D-glutamate--2,6-diaminopimelate ligase
MGKTATVNSDWAIFTSDNPRSEDPNSIIEEMGGMLDAILEKRVIRLADRRAAIQLAVKLASQGDIVLVAGKGHEKYQEIKGKKLPFDDKIELENALWAL